MKSTMASLAPEIEVWVKYIHPRGNKGGSFGILPESVELAESYRAQYGITTEWLHVFDPATRMNLKAFRPIEGSTLAYVREGLGIRDGQVCVLTQKAIQMGGRTVWRFVNIRPVSRCLDGVRERAEVSHPTEKEPLLVGP